MDIPIPPPLMLTSSNYGEEQIKLVQKKNKTYDVKDIYFKLKETVPLYDFKGLYTIDKITCNFIEYELRELKKKYILNGMDHHYNAYMDELHRPKRKMRQTNLKI